MINKTHFGIKYSLSGKDYQRELMTLAIEAYGFLLGVGKTSWVDFSKIIGAYSNSDQTLAICNAINTLE